MEKQIEVTITHRAGYDQTVTTTDKFEDMESLSTWVVAFIGAENLISMEFATEQPEEVDSLTGISATVFTLPDGRELPELKWEDEGWELRRWLREIDQAMNSTGWGHFGERHGEWDSAWSDEFFRIRKAMGIYDPYSQKF